METNTNTSTLAYTVGVPVEPGTTPVVLVRDGVVYTTFLRQEGTVWSSIRTAEGAPIAVTMNGLQWFSPVTGDVPEQEQASYDARVQIKMSDGTTWATNDVYAPVSWLPVLTASVRSIAAFFRASFSDTAREKQGEEEDSL